MALRASGIAAATLAACALIVAATLATGAAPVPPLFHTSDRCVACHNGLLTASGHDVSIGFDWRASIMANSSRDPYWQASVRREAIDHAQSAGAIEDECAICHMPIVRYEANVRGEKAKVFAHLPLNGNDPDGRAAADGVSCSVCHQIGTARLGTPESFNGGFVVQPPQAGEPRPEYGRFQVEPGHTRIMLSSSEGYRPTQSDHVRRSELCATCHTLITQALGPDGRVIGHLPEQVPYQEWLHSDYREKESCQSCHMPVVDEPAPITRVFGQPRQGMARHTFVAANFFMQRMLNRYRDALDVAALPQELTNAADGTLAYLASRAAKLEVENVRMDAGRLLADVVVENLGGHKLPTAYPSRRAWLHVTIRDAGGHTIFESGALNSNGSIQGNDNDADPAAFEPHYPEIRRSDQVQIYESILGDATGAVTTGLLSAVRYLKDNRVLPHGFDKATAADEIAVHGSATDDDDFGGGRDRVRYSAEIGNAAGPFTVTAELLYQPIGFRWANNLKRYGAAEPQRLSSYYDAMASASAAMLARAEASSTP